MQRMHSCIQRSGLEARNTRADESPSKCCSTAKESFNMLHSGEESALPMQEIQEMRVQSLGWEDPLEKKMATHSGILAWKIPSTQKPGYSQWDCKELDLTERRSTHTALRSLQVHWRCGVFKCTGGSSSLDVMVTLEMQNSVFCDPRSVASS